MFDSLADLFGKLASTGYFIDPVMFEVVFLGPSCGSLFCWKDRPVPAKLNWPYLWRLRRETRAEGVVLSRKYSEMRLANLAGAGRAVQEFQL
jgi:hypothetical protein